MKTGMRVMKGLLLLAAGCLVGFAVRGEEQPVPRAVRQVEAAPAPAAVARPFYGVLDGRLLVAGGSTYEGGKKGYVSTIWRYSAEQRKWEVLPNQLPEGLAEGGAAVMKVRDEKGGTQEALVCMGGVAVGPQGTASAQGKAFLLRQDGSQEPLPGLRIGANGEIETLAVGEAGVTLSMPAAVTWGDGVAFVCGKLDGQLSNRVLTLSQVEVKGADGKKAWQWKWGELPVLPGAPREQAVAVVQNGDQKRVELVVYGGSVLGTDGKPMAAYDGYSYAKRFDGKFAWQRLKVDAPVATIGAGFVAVGNQHVLLVGGYWGDLWDRANRMSKEAWQQKLGEEPAAFGWNRTIYAYHPVTGTWVNYGALPADELPRCGAAVAWMKVGSGHELVVAGGEVKPAQRTRAVMQLAFDRQGWRFSWLSWVVIGCFFLLMVGMGVYFALKPKTADSYFRGGKSIPWYVAGVSIYATMLSSLTFIAVPTMTYISDWRYFTLTLCTLALAPVAICFYLPFFCRLNITSAYEYLEKRFDVSIRLFGATVFNIFMVCRVAVVTLLPALALGAVTGMPIWMAIVLCGVATIIYCFFGGVEAVIWSDFVQGLILLLGAVVVLVVLVMSSGGMGEFASVARSAGKLKMWDFRFLLSEPVFWVVLIMGFVENLNSYTADQCVVQRYITCPDEKAAARSIWFNGFLSVGSSVIFYLIGTALYTHYVKHPELMDVTMPKSDSVFPIFMAIELHPLISGLIVASVFAATISTLSTNLNSAATSIVTDFMARFKKGGMSGPQQVWWGRICVVIVGALGVTAALILSGMPNQSLFDVFKNFIGTLTGGLSALFLMGIFMPRVGGLAAFIALMANYVISLGIGCVFPKLHSFTYGGIALVVCIVLAYVLSFVFPNKRSIEGLSIVSKPKGMA